MKRQGVKRLQYREQGEVLVRRKGEDEEDTGGEE